MKNNKFEVVQAGGEWHVVMIGSRAARHPEMLAQCPGWPTREQAEQAAKENGELSWLE